MSLKLEYSLSVNANPDQIWQVFNEIERWPRWDPDALQSVRWTEGTPWAKGSKFELKVARPMPFTLRPQIVDVQPPVFVHVKGSGSGVNGEQVYIFTFNPDANATEMRTIQEFSGMPIQMFGAKAREPLLRGIEHMFQQIKREAEELALGVGPNAPTA